MRRAAVAAALVVAGCGGEERRVWVPAASVERAIRAGYKQQTGVALARISCANVTPRVGARVSCRATNTKRVDLKIAGRVTAVADETTYRWDVVEAVAPGTLFADAAKRRLVAQTGATIRSFTCPRRIRVRAGTTVRCELVTGDRETVGATLTLTHARGSFDIRVDAKARGE